MAREKAGRFSAFFATMDTREYIAPQVLVGTNGDGTIIHPIGCGDACVQG